MDFLFLGIYFNQDNTLDWIGGGWEQVSTDRWVERFYNTAVSLDKQKKPSPGLIGQSDGVSGVGGLWNARITYGRDHGETVNGRVDEAPRAAAAIRGRACLERVVQLLLELDKFPTGRLLPLVRAHPSAVRPQPVQEVALHSLHAALIERLERAFGVTEHQTSYAAHDHQYHLWCIGHETASDMYRANGYPEEGLHESRSQTLCLPFPTPSRMTRPVGRQGIGCVL